MSGDEQLAIELLAYKDSVAGSIMVMLEDVRIARGEAERWRDAFCRLSARGGVEYEALKAKYLLEWENQKEQRS